MSTAVVLGSFMGLRGENCSFTFIDGVEVDTVAQASVDAMQHLAETDWYIVRFTETGVAVPNSVTASRAAARASIV